MATIYREGTRDISAMNAILAHKEEILNPERNLIAEYGFKSFDTGVQYTPQMLREIADKMEANRIALVEFDISTGYYDEYSFDTDHARFETDKEFAHRMEVRETVLVKIAEHDALIAKSKEREERSERIRKENEEIEHYKRLDRKYRGKINAV